MFRFFDWLAMRESPDWIYFTATIGSGIAFGLIFGYILVMSARMI